MGTLDNIKDAAEATGKKIARAAEDIADKVSDKADEVKADAAVKKSEAEVKKAESDRDATAKKNEYKESLRD